MTDERRPPGSWPTPSILDDGDGTTVVGLRETPVFALSARLADLALCDVSRSGNEGFGLVVAHGGFGGWIAPYAAFRIARAGYDAVVIWRPGPSVAGDEAPMTLVCGRAASGQGEGLLLVSPRTVYKAARPQDDGGKTMRRDRHFSERLRRVNAERPDESVFAIIAARPSAAEPGCYRVPDLCSNSDVMPRFDEVGILDAVIRLHRAIAEGIEVESEAHGTLMRLSLAIRLPNTDRSRTQAG